MTAVRECLNRQRPFGKFDRQADMASKFGLNPDPAVTIDRKREAQPFRSKCDGFLPLSRHLSTVPGEDAEPHGNDVRKPKNHFETSQSDAFAASGFRLAPDIFGLTAESGIK
jgi:hypothetical protein